MNNIAIESFISYCDDMMIAEEASNSTFKERVKNTFARRKSGNNYLPNFQFAGIPVELKINGSKIEALEKGDKKRLGRYFKKAMTTFQGEHKRLLKKALNAVSTKLSNVSKSSIKNVDVARVVILGDGDEDYKIWKSSNNEYNIIVYYTFKSDKENALKVGYSITVTTQVQPGYQVGGNGGAYVNIETTVHTDISHKIIKASAIDTDI